MIFIIMGVSGSGKTTVGTLLSEKLNCSFYDADEFHPPANVAKMSLGHALNDEDRKPWLDNLHQAIGTWLAQKQHVVLACSALKENYRLTLSDNSPEVKFVYLKGRIDQIRPRVLNRQAHFMPASLLESQFETLEEPAEALTIEISQTPAEAVQTIISAFDLQPSQR